MIEDTTENPEMNKPSVPAAATSELTGADAYIQPDGSPEHNEDMIINPRSPTPPPQLKTQQTSKTVKKGIGKSTIKRPAPPVSQTPAKKKLPVKAKQNPSSACSSCSSSKKQTPPSEDSALSSVEKERLNVLKELSANLNKEDDGSEEYHWSISLGQQAKRVPYARLKVKAIAHINAVMSDAVLGEAHPALGMGNSPSYQYTPHMPSMAYTKPVHPQQQTQYYIPTPNMYQSAQSQAGPTSTGISTSVPSQTATATSKNMQPEVTPTPSTPKEQHHQIYNPSLHQNQQISQSQVPYGQINTNELAGFINMSPLKVMPPIRCHTINNFGPPPSAQATLDFANL